VVVGAEVGCRLVDRFLVDRFLAPFFLADRLADFLAAFFFVDFLAVDFFAALRFFAIEYGSFRCSARSVLVGRSTGALTIGDDNRQTNDNGSSTNGWLELRCRLRSFDPSTRECLLARIEPIIG
jgi:hypothetical protein